MVADCIDTMATAIKGGMAVFDLEDLELAYAPPYSSAKPPVNIAGYVAANVLRGDIEVIKWDDLEQIDREGVKIIDVRTKKELGLLGKIEGSLHIPIDELRDRVPELERAKSYVLYCALGQRSYIGHRILVQNGFDSKSLGGGYRIYRAAKAG